MPPGTEHQQQMKQQPPQMQFFQQVQSSSVSLLGFFLLYKFRYDLFLDATIWSAATAFLTTQHAPL